MLCDYVLHSKCGEHVYVDEWSEHVAECTGPQPTDSKGSTL